MRASYLIAGAVGLTAMVTGCSSVQHLSGDAVPAGSPALVSAAVASNVTTSSDGARARATLLGPAGYGALKLGMTRQQAQATGLVVGYTTDGPNPACPQAQLTGAPSGEGVVWYSADHVVAISSYGSIGTPQGVRLGLASTTVRQLYPNWEVLGSDADGRGYAAVPGNTSAQYRIETTKGKVVSLTLQASTQTCFE